ncbi:MAG: DUF4397 domain-containing protein [Evtepia sp.]
MKETKNSLPNPGDGGSDLPRFHTDGIPVIPLPNPGEGGPAFPGPVYPGDSNTDNIPVIPLPNPGEGGPAFPGPDTGGSGGTPVIPLPEPGFPVGPDIVYPIIPLPNPGGPAYPVWRQYSRARFLNASYGYRPFRIFINNVRVVNFLSSASVSYSIRVPAGYQTVTIAGADGYIYIQKSMPFEANRATTIAIINTASGLDLIQIADTCCPAGNGYSGFRVSNLAYSSRPMDVLLADERVVFADVRFKETTPLKRIRPGNYQFYFAETSLLPMPLAQDIETLDGAFVGLYPSPNILASLSLRILRNATYTAYIISTGPTPSDLQVFSIEDS